MLCPALGQHRDYAPLTQSPTVWLRIISTIALKTVRLLTRPPAFASDRWNWIAPQNGIVLRVADSAIYNGKPVKPQREGYCLNVEENSVLITGFDEPGLYYGIVTFFQLMKNSMRIEDRMPVSWAGFAG
jgi:hypothetical protein